MSETVTKKYVLIDAVKSTAQIFVGERDTDKAFRLDTPRQVGLYLKHNFTDKSGKRKITRFKLGANSIFQDEQIKNDMILANERFTTDERRTLYLINGVLVTDDEFLQSFLHEDNNPQRLEFTGRSRGSITPLIMELDEEKISDDENDFIFRTAEAIMKIRSMTKDEAAAFVALFRGASYPIPERLKDCQNILSKDLEGSDERINMILNADINPDSQVVILLNKAINKGILSFEIKPDFVQVKRGEQWLDAKMVVADSYEEREILFRQYLASPEGELLRKDIESLLSEEVGETPTKAKRR
jgi:hypothetical protein